MAESPLPDDAATRLITTLQTSGDQLLLVVAGDIDLTSRAQLPGAVDDALTGLGQRRLVLDLKRVRVIDSTGLGELIGCLTRCDHEGAAWELRPSASVERLMTLVGVGRLRSDQSGSWLSSGGYGGE
jgi:anti-anti-sigma factor